MVGQGRGSTKSQNSSVGSESAPHFNIGPRFEASHGSGGGPERDKVVGRGRGSTKSQNRWGQRPRPGSHMKTL